MEEEEEKAKAEEEKARTEEEIKEISAEQVKSENKILKSFLLLAGVLLFGFVAFMVFQGGFGNNDEIFVPENFTFRGIDYQKEKKGEITFYKTSFPVTFQGRNYDYEIRTRKDPRELNKSVHLKGDFLFRETRNVILKFDEGLKCKTETIAVANFYKLGIFGANITLDDNASCPNEDEDFLLINVRDANETAIIQTGNLCYDFNVNDCEVLDVTERYMLEVFSFVNKL